MNLFIRYSIDVFKRKDISGWCYNRTCKTKPVILFFYVDGKECGSTVAQLLREDLKVQQIHPTGKCGFHFLLPFDFELNPFSKITIHVKGSKTPLTTLKKSDVFNPIDKKKTLFSNSRSLFTRKKAIPPIFFMHIPKTTGTTFNSFARELFSGQESISHIKAYDKSKYNDFQQRYTFISGHLTYGEIKGGFDTEKMRLVTILREPVKHLHSHLNWLKQVGEIPDSDFFKMHNDITQRMAQKINRYDFSRPEGIREFIEHLEGMEFDFFDNCQSRFFLTKRPNKVREYHFDEIRNNLSAFYCIGFTEQYDDFVREFCRKLQLQKIRRVKGQKYLNKSKSAPLFDLGDPEILAAIHPLIESDLKLYSLVQNQKNG